MKYPYTCKICNSRWDATSPNFKESHVASEAHRVKKPEADNVALLDALDNIRRIVNVAMSYKRIYKGVAENISQTIRSCPMGGRASAGRDTLYPNL